MLAAFSLIIVLHNSHDLGSREFVKALPKGQKNIQVIDWYRDPKARFTYDGPPPSAFPSVVVKLPDGRFALARTPRDLKQVESLDTSGGGTNSFESMAPAGKYIGGIQIWEAENLLKWGWPSDREEKAILAGLARIGRPMNKQELKMARAQRPPLREVPGLEDCQKQAISAESDPWKRLSFVRQCLHDAADLQLRQLLVTNLAERDPNAFARALADAVKKQELAKRLEQALANPLPVAPVPVTP